MNGIRFRKELIIMDKKIVKTNIVYLLFKIYIRTNCPYSNRYGNYIFILPRWRLRRSYLFNGPPLIALSGMFSVSALSLKKQYKKI